MSANDDLPTAGGRADPSESAAPNGPALAVAAIILFLLALGFPALGRCIDSGAGSVDWISNRDIVLGGPIAPFFFEFGWYANIPFAIAAFALLRRRPVAIWLIASHAALVLSSLLPVPLLGASEAPAHLCRWGLGYWMWFGAQVMVIAASLAPRFSRSE